MKYHKNAFIYAPQGIYMRTLLGIHGYPKVPTFDPDFDSVKKKAERYLVFRDGQTDKVIYRDCFVSKKIFKNK